MRMTELLESNLSKAYALAYTLTNRPDDAEDAVNTAVAYILSHSSSYDRARPFFPYFAKIILNALNKRRTAEGQRRQREQIHAMMIANEERKGTEMEKNETTAWVRAALAELPEDERTAVVLTHLQGFTQAEASETLGIAQQTLSDRVRRGMEKMRRRLKQAGISEAAVPLALANLWNEPAPRSIFENATRLAKKAAFKTAATAVVGTACAALLGVSLLFAASSDDSPPTSPPNTPGEEKTTAQAPNPAPPETTAGEKDAERKFDTPIWHPDAEWESTGRFLGSVMPANGAGWLDGPKQEMVCRERHPGPWGSPYGGHERCVWACLDEKTERYHVVAGAEVYGYLDGPFSRARHGGWGYMDRAFSLMTPDRRYLYTADMHNGRMIRRLDFMKQEIATVQWEVENFTGLTMGQDGKIYAVTPPHLAVLNQDGKLERKIALELKGDVGWEASMAHDPKRNRMWATSGHNPKRQWHVWYWDLADGSFHGEVPAKAKQPGDHMFGGAPGSYKDGWFVYPQSHVYFGPDDPDYRFLYMSHTDCGNSHRLDLEKKEVWVLSGPPRNKSGPIRYVFKREEINPFEPHTGPSWRPNGDFTMPTGGSAGLGIVLYKRVK